ncbi:MAG TPA: winged helix-turn-helix domain-containing protein [Streptosporangiaceae bacterium]|nr:winged helix-turn-helix domain-containing protein [Streptosporangiaceae bacterium]
MSGEDVVDPGLPVPAYRQLEVILRRRIAAGEWRTGPLPSVAYLQQEYEVGRDTVLHALRLLREAGLIFTIPKRGSYVAAAAAGADDLQLDIARKP